MRTTSLSDLLLNIEQTIDSVNADHEPIMVTRGLGQPAAVLMSAEDFASLEETAYLLGSPRNAERLIKAIENLEQGFGVEHELLG